MSDFRYASSHDLHDLQHSGYTPSYFQTATNQDPHRIHSTSHNDTYTVLGNYHYADSTPGQSSYLVKSSDNVYPSAAYTIEDKAHLYSSKLLSSPGSTYLATEKLSPSSDHHSSTYTKDYPYTSHLSTYDHHYTPKEVPKSSTYPSATSHYTSDILSLDGKGFKYQPSHHTASPESKYTTYSSPHKSEGYFNDKTNQDLQYIDKIIADIKTRHAKINDLQSSTLDTITHKTDSLSHRANNHYESPVKSSYTSGYGSGYTSTYGDSAAYKKHDSYVPKHTSYDDYSEFSDCNSIYDPYSSSVKHRNTGREEKVKSSAYSSIYGGRATTKQARSPLMLGVLILSILLFILAFYFMLF